MKKARPIWPGFLLFVVPRSAYFEMRSCERLVPIALNVVTIWLAEVSRKNLLLSGYLPGLPAQFCSKVEVGSPPVFTWIA